MIWLFSLLFTRNCNVIPFDIHGEFKEIQADENGWAYFGVGFGDFGHTVNVRAYSGNNATEEIYYSFGHDCPTANSTKLTKNQAFLSDPTQYAIFGVVVQPNEKANVLLASNVKPIHPNSAAALIFSFFVFFGINFLVTGILQFFYFKSSMNPLEYQALNQDN